MRKRTKSIVVSLMLMAVLVFSAMPIYAMESENPTSAVYPIYDSIEEAERHLEDNPSVDLFFPQSTIDLDGRITVMPTGLLPDATMTPFFVRAGGDKVHMYCHYVGKKSASILSIDSVSLYKPGILGDLIDVEYNIYTKSPAATNKNFSAGFYIVPTSIKKVRISWTDAKVDILGVGWVAASSPQGSWDV